ncbi:hypothetical protein RRG08_066805 [Elysia crispata]|uniref:Uncharacterized protein n=1 Tax=Elysia crispata TaxID=231223 RepID=A0AAE0Y8U2_9GAST|nr:hypothetical protein RRG08_066805 [Elysia crispata]
MIVTKDDDSRPSIMIVTKDDDSRPSINEVRYSNDVDDGEDNDNKVEKEKDRHEDGDDDDGVDDDDDDDDQCDKVRMAVIWRIYSSLFEVRVRAGSTPLAITKKLH